MKRDILQKLEKWKNKEGRKPLILRGVRQVGKTYILNEFGERFFPRAHYINFEKNHGVAAAFDPDLDPKKIIQRLNFILKTSIHIEQDLLILDEIQEVPRALTSLKYFAEEIPELALCAAGSLLGVPLGPVSFPVGKVDTLFMYPMSFREFLMAIGEEQELSYLDEAVRTKALPEIVHKALWEHLKWYFITGGLPEVVATFCKQRDNLFQAFQAAREVQAELILAYNADMAKHSGKINAMHLTRLWKAIPEQLAKSQDAGAKKFTFKDAIPGINRYDRLVGVIDWLEAAGLIIKVHITETGQVPFSAYAKENCFKLFLMDIGILGALSGIDPELILAYDYGSYNGYFAENYAAQEFVCYGMGPLFSWQENTAEVEFLFQKAGQVIPAEVKSGWITHAKSIHLFAAKYKSPFRVILSAHNVHVDEHSPIRRYPLYLAGQILA